MTTEPPAKLDRQLLPGIFAVMDRLEAALKLPPHFLESILNEDDWSFILKLHALMEASLTVLLSEHLAGGKNNPRLTDAMSYLDMSGVRVGKVTLATALGLIREEEERLIRYLSELRNLYVHRIENVTLRLDTHVAGMDKNQREKFLKAMIRLPLTPEHLTPATIDQIMAQPKVNIWAAAFSALFMVILKLSELKLARGEPGYITVADAPHLLKDVGTLLRAVAPALRPQKPTAPGTS